MEKEMVEYLNGTRNSVSACVHMSRESMNNTERIYIGVPDTKDTLYVFYNSKAKKEKFEKVSDAAGFSFIPVPAAGTGGKEAYAMLMLAEHEKLLGLSREAKAMLFDLFNCIEWNTNRVIRQRDEKPMTKAMFSQQFEIKPWAVRRALEELTKNKVIHYDRKQKAYFLSRHFIKKGESRK